VRNRHGSMSALYFSSKYSGGKVAVLRVIPAPP
jgi:hypothetical protein